MGPKLNGVDARYELNLLKYSGRGVRCRQIAASRGGKGASVGLRGEGRQWGVNSYVTVSHGGVNGGKSGLEKNSSSNGVLSKLLVTLRHVGNSTLDGKLWELAAWLVSIEFNHDTKLIELKLKFDMKPLVSLALDNFLVQSQLTDVLSHYLHLRPVPQENCGHAMEQFSNIGRISLTQDLVYVLQRLLAPSPPIPIFQFWW
ncbi:hypothetical protein DFH06DRAFT_1130329 [Mycena polygramma]|nr:hypothetical protein DFH06DRAFT_1130329 [Mycena polygramma]